MTSPGGESRSARTRIGRRAAQGLALVGGVLLLGGLEIAPRLDPAALGLVALGWAALLVVMVIATIRLLARRIGFAVPIAGLVLGVGALLILTGVDWKGSLGPRMPCRRNWGWMPSYLLRSSPTRSVRFRVGATRVQVCFGSPRARGRRMLGGTPVPYGQLWRTGANEPTTIRTDGPITVAGIRVPPGSASLYTIPGPESWEVILNQSTSQWGLESQYTEAIRARELGRTVIRSHRLPTYVEALAIEAVPSAGGHIDLTIQWERTEVRLPVAAAP